MGHILRHIVQFVSIMLIGYLCVFKANSQNLKDFDGADAHLEKTSMEQADPKNDIETSYITQHYKHHKILPEHRHNKKYRVITGSGLHLHPPVPVSPNVSEVFFPEVVVHTPSIQARYTYKYFKEINPPPPKAC